MKIKYFLSLWGFLIYGNEVRNLNISCRKTDNVNEQNRINWFLENIRKAREIQTGLCQLTTPSVNDSTAPVNNQAAQIVQNQNPFERFLELVESIDSLQGELSSLEIEQFLSRPQPNIINYTNCRNACGDQRERNRSFDIHGCLRRCLQDNPEEVRLLNEWRTEENRLCGQFGCSMRGSQSRQLRGMGEPQQTPNLEARIQELRDHINRWEQELNQLIAPNVRTFESQIQNPEANCDQTCQWRARNRLQRFQNAQRQSGVAVRGGNPMMGMGPFGNFQF